jgi:protein-disulfide isomerase
MASRTKQKEEARARRIAEERAAAERARRTRRTRTLAGVLIAAVVVVAVAIAISSSGGGSSSSTKISSSTSNHISSLLTGLPQSGQTLGSPSAKVTVTEFGDLQCPICRDFALGAEQQLIAKDVRSGKVKLVYKSLPTATLNGPNPSVFPTQQAAAYAAGQQSKAWDYILLFYRQQGQEGTNYVTPAFLQNLARHIPGLNYSAWLTASKNPNLTAQVTSEQQQATSRGFNSTPTIVVQGPKGQAQPVVGNTDYGTLESVINSVA